MRRCVSVLFFIKSEHSFFSMKTFFFSETLTNDRPTVAINVSTIQGNPEDKETCPRCGGIVFHAEKMLSKSSVSAFSFTKFFHLVQYFKIV